MRDRARLFDRDRSERGGASLEVALVTGFASCVAAVMFALLQSTVGTWLADTATTATNITVPVCESPETEAEVKECFTPEAAALIDGQKIAETLQQISFNP